MLADLGEHTGTFTHLIRDRGGQFTDSFDAVFASEAVLRVEVPVSVGFSLASVLPGV